MKSGSQLSAAGLATFAVLIWATPPVLARALSGAIPPIALSYSRWVLGLVVLLPFVWKRLPQEWPKLRPHWFSLALLALFMIAGSTLATVSVYFTTATNAVLVNASQPAITACVTYLVARERLALIQAVGVAFAFAGILVMISRADLGDRQAVVAGERRSAADRSRLQSFAFGTEPPLQR